MCAHIFKILGRNEVYLYFLFSKSLHEKNTRRWAEVIKILNSEIKKGQMVVSDVMAAFS
jgi:hypothetical protein